MYDSVTSQVRPVFSTDVRATRRLGSKKTRPKRFDEGRVCESFECATVLSVYNRQKVCYTHQPRKAPRLRGIPRK